MPDNELRIIDIDGHVREADDLFERYLEPPFRARAPRVEKVANGQVLFRLEGERPPVLDALHRWLDSWRGIGDVVGAWPTRPDETPFRVKDDGSPANENRHLATDPKDRLRAMDRDRIERGLLFPSAGLYLPSVQEEAYAAALCRAYNNWLYDYCGEDRNRLMGVGVIPIQDVKLAIAEAKRVVNELGFKGIFVRPNPVKGRDIDDAYYDPLYKTIVELGIPLLVHEGSGAFLPTAGADRFAFPIEVQTGSRLPGNESAMRYVGMNCGKSIEGYSTRSSLSHRCHSNPSRASSRHRRDPDPTGASRRSYPDGRYRRRTSRQAFPSAVAENETERLFPPSVLHVVRSRRDPSR